MSSEMKTCGDCQHLDNAPLPTADTRQVHWCRALKSWQLATLPRGEPDSVFWCDKWSDIGDLNPQSELIS